MAKVIRMPQMSDTMEEGVIESWHKKVGDFVEIGDLLAEIETDKATMDFESYDEGYILHIGVEKGMAAKVNSLLVILGDKDEDYTELLAKEGEATEAPAEEKVVEEKIEEKAAPEVKEVKETVEVATSQASQVNKAAVVEDRPAPAPVQASENYKDEPLSQMRKAIARVVSKSKYSSPHVYMTISVNMDKIMAERKRLNLISPTKISFNDLIILASIIGLKKMPELNCSWKETHIRYNKNINIGVAVAVEKGLLIPVVRNVETKSLAQISAEIKDLGQRAKNNKLKPEETQENTFTISNLGMLDILKFTSIIYQPSACILAVGGINKEPTIIDGEITSSNQMKLTLSVDNRAVSQIDGAKFLSIMRECLEEPSSMLLNS